jgi:hypothetical protein
MTHRIFLPAIVSVMMLWLVIPGFAAVESQGGGIVPPDMSHDTSPTPHEYSIPPVNPKSLKPADSHPWVHQPVMNLKDEKLGTIEAVMVDTKSGKDVYAMLKLRQDMYPMPIPLKAIREAETGLVLNANREQLMHGAPNLGGQSKSHDFEHLGGEPLKPNLRQGGG